MKTGGVPGISEEARQELQGPAQQEPMSSRLKGLGASKSSITTGRMEELTGQNMIKTV